MPIDHVYGLEKTADAKTSAGMGGGGRGEGVGTDAAPMPDDYRGLVRVRWRYRTTPYGHAIDALDENGNTLMAYPYSDPAADGNSGGIAVAWRRFEPVLRTVVYGLLLVEICIAVLLGMYSL